MRGELSSNSALHHKENGCEGGAGVNAVQTMAKRYRDHQLNSRIHQLVGETFRLRAKQKRLSTRQALEQALQYWCINTGEAERVCPVRKAPMVEASKIKAPSVNELFQL